jgi:hypothetical protein
MPFGIRPSNVRVCHSTTRALLARAPKLSAVRSSWQVSFLFVLMLLLVIETRVQTLTGHDRGHENEIPAISD